MGTLDSPQIDRDLVLQRRVDPVEVVFQQHVLGRDGGVGFQLEHPVAIRVLPGAQSLRRAADHAIQLTQIDRDGCRLRFGVGLVVRGHDVRGHRKGSVCYGE